MAALEKIRSKSVMLLIVIGVALLAFIIGDFLNSGRSFFGAGTTVAKVDGEKISIIDFQKRYEEQNQRLQESNQKVDPALVQNQVLNQMINEQLLKEELDALCLTVSDAEITEAMTGETANYQVIQFAQQLGMESPAQLHEFIFNPGKFKATEADVAPVREQWLKLEEQTIQQLKAGKLGNLITGAIQANKLDKAALLAENNDGASVEIVNEQYASLKDDEFKVTDEELKARYDKEKQQYKIDQELRKIHFISVDIVPNDKDLAEAKAVFDKVEAALRGNVGLDAARNIGEASINQKTVRLSDVYGAQKTFLEAAAVEDVSAPTFEGYTHKVTKLLAKKNDVDSVRVDMIQVQGAKKVQDSVLNLLNSGKPFAEVVDNKVAVGQENQWMNLMQIGNEDKAQEAKAKILAAADGYFVVDSNENAALIYKVHEKVAPKAMFDIAEVSYTVYPSDETIDGLRTNLQDYINTNNTGKKFIDNATAKGYTAMEATVAADMAQINRIESTRKEIQWAFGAEIGSVSPIFDKEGNDKMIALTLDEVIPAGYMPLSDPSVKANIERLVRNDKKAESLIAKYKGKANSISAYAQLMKQKVDTITVNFAQDFIPGIGMESVLSAQAPYAKENTIQGPVKGDQGVFVYKVVKKEKAASTLSDDVIDQRFAGQFGGSVVSQLFFDILKEGKTIKNNLIEFY